MCVVKGVRINHTITPAPIFRASQFPRPVEPSAIQVMVDQLHGLATNFSNTGLNSTNQTNSTFSLPGFYT